MDSIEKSQQHYEKGITRKDKIPKQKVTGKIGYSTLE